MYDHHSAAANGQQVSAANRDEDNRVKARIDFRHMHIARSRFRNNLGKALRLVVFKPERFDHANTG